jgi:hypothetical protein
VAGPFQKKRAISSNPTKIPGPFIERPARYTLVKHGHDFLGHRHFW